MLSHPALEVLVVSLRLGLTSFGGPIAHLGYFRAEYVQRRRWLDDAAYADLVALCQFLPGPASSQVGIAIGTMRAGTLGGVLAWIGFTLPSVLLMLLAAAGVAAFDVDDSGWLHGLKVAAVAVVAQAVWGMARTLTPDRERVTIAVVAAAIVLLVAHPAVQVLAIALGGVAGWLRTRHVPVEAPPTPTPAPVGRRFASARLLAWVALLVALPVAAGLVEAPALAITDAFYRAGSLIFGGGHVVLPLLERAVVPEWVSRDEFVAGYGAAQAVPGPLLSFSAYLGALAGVLPAPAGASVAVVAIFAPSFLLVWGALPFWHALRGDADVQAAMRGIGAAVVGILLAALYDPVWTAAILEPADVALAAVGVALLMAWRWPPWAVVLMAAAGGELLARV